MIRAPDVETCREEKINANLLSKFQLLPAEVNETERKKLNGTKPRAVLGQVICRARGDKFYEYYLIVYSQRIQIFNYVYFGLCFDSRAAN